MAEPPAYTGAWRNQSRYVDRALAPAPGVDPAHNIPDAPDSGQIPAGYPRVDYPPLYLTESEEASYAAALDTPGLMLDVEPIEHDPRDPDVIHPAPVQGADSAPPQALAHAVDRGGAKRTSYEEPQMRAADEEYRTPRWEQAAISTGSTLAALRGDNALPENNPDGFRLGWSVKRFLHREMLHEWFRHDERALRPNTAARAVQSLAMARGNSNRYTSPFSWNVRAMGNLL